MRSGKHSRSFERADIANSGAEQIRRQKSFVIPDIESLAIGDYGVSQRRGEQSHQAGTLSAQKYQARWRL